MARRYMPIGTVTEVSEESRRVTFRTSVVLVGESDLVRFRGGGHSSEHMTSSMEVDQKRVDGCLPDDEVAIYIPEGELPPRGTQVFLRLGFTD